MSAAMHQCPSAVNVAARDDAVLNTKQNVKTLPNWRRQFFRRIDQKLRQLRPVQHHKNKTKGVVSQRRLEMTKQHLLIKRLGKKQHKISMTRFLAMTFAILAFVCAFQLQSAFGQSSNKTKNKHNIIWSPLYSMLSSVWKRNSGNYAMEFAKHLKTNWQTKSSWFSFRFTRSSSTCKGDYSNDPQLLAVDSLLSRRFPSLASRVFFSRQITCSTNKGGCFSISVEEGNLCIRGSSGVDLATGLHWFLKNECHGLSTWEKTGGTQYHSNCLTSEHIAQLETNFELSKSRSVPISFYQNVVTSSYSMAYWDWPRWETEIDWMALHGVNLPLALLGQEFIWTRVYKELGIQFEELEDFFTGPSFLAWGRMGNIQGYGGPLPWSYIQSQSRLQLKIVGRMRSFGMTPVFSGFAGFVPRAFAAKYPKAKVKKSANWCNFPEQYCCVLILDPTDPFFTQIGSLFLKYQREVYGYDNVGFYAVDVFNEMTPVQSDPEYLQKTSNAIYSVLKSVESQPIWIMQAWLFYSDQEFWKPKQIQAVLSGVPTGRLLLLDLYAERYPQWKRTDAFYGHPFIWCSLNNFGGNIEMHGAMSQIAQGLYDAQIARSNVVGIGMCPEGLEQNPVVYELASEIAYRETAPELRKWFDAYVLQRYGGKECKGVFKGWKMLSESVYENTGHRCETVMDIPVSRPGLDSKEDFWGLKPQLWYNPNKVIEAWKCFLDCTTVLGSLSSFQYDLIDISRQVLSKLATKYWKQIVSLYIKKDLGGLVESGDKLLVLLEDMDRLLSTHKGFLFGPLLLEARNYGDSELEKDLMERNLKLQVTIWGESPSGDTELSDYANRELSGLMMTFYRERWKLWIERLKKDLEFDQEYNSKEFRDDIINFAYDWISKPHKDVFGTSPIENRSEISREIYQKYKNEA
eukprot:g8064.t1